MKDLILFDGHCDTPLALWENQTQLAANPGRNDLRRSEALAGWAQFYAFCTGYSQETDRLTAPEILRASYDYFMDQLDRNHLTVSKNATQVQQALSERRVACMLCLEGPEPIQDDPGKLELLAEAGFSAVMPTWNNSNTLADCHKGSAGLSARGREFVRKAQKLKMMVDVSHISDRAFWDICEITEKPIVASHSNSRAVREHSRNLTDEMYRALCQLGGMTGLNFYYNFLQEKGPDFETIWRHLDHFLQLAGSDRHVGLGGDLDGCDVTAQGMDGLQSYPALAEFLSAKGLSDAALARIFYENWMEVYNKCTM